MNNHSLVAAMASSLFVACSGGAPNQPTDAGACFSGFAGGNVDWGCITCTTPENVQASNDGSSSSFSRVQLKSITDSVVDTGPVVTFTVDSPPGISYPSGTGVGVIARMPEGLGDTYEIAVSSTLNGIQRESFVFTQADGQDLGANDKLYLAETQLAYDGLEAQFSVRRIDRIESSEIRIYEFCAGD